MVTLMHYNPTLPHQVRHAEAFKAAGVEITPSPDGDADVHIVSGPYFALPRWNGHPNLILLDRAFYGDPEYISLCWLNPDGTKTYAEGSEPRYKPELRPWKAPRESSLQAALVLADYQQDVLATVCEATHRFGFAGQRRHPAENDAKLKECLPLTLREELEITDVCIGHSSTALFEAVAMGVPVICTDPQNVVRDVSTRSMDEPLFRGDRTDWLHRVSWMQWNHDEFGLAIGHLMRLRGM